MGMNESTRANEAYELKLFNDIVDVVINHANARSIKSIVITGSLGRGEGIYTTLLDGSVKLRSDVEVALVYTGSRASMGKTIKYVAGCFAEELNLMPITLRRIKYAHNYSYSIICPKKKTLFTIDLYNGSKTVWGEDYLKRQILSIEDCDIYEAKRLVANRIGELVWNQKRADCLQETQIVRQWKGKLILAIGSAWLIVRGKYKTSGAEQCALLMRYRRDVEKELGSHFVDDFERVYVFLRAGGAEYEVLNEKLIDYLKAIDELFKKGNLNKSRSNNYAKKLKMCWKFIKYTRKFPNVAYEDCILQRLIDEYIKQDDYLYDTSELWYNVLY